jgi:two-component system sensor histidine kinase/response regulator
MKNSTLFYNEEQVLETTNKRLDEFKRQTADQLNEYEKLITDYDKLLKQTKLLVTLTERQQQQLDDRNQDNKSFIKIVTEDLKNPLVGIQDLAELLANRFDELPKERIIELLTVIKDTTHQVFDLISEMICMNNIDSQNMNLKLDSMNILPCLKSLVNEHQNQAKLKDITIEFDSTDEKYYCLADEKAVCKVFGHLVSNAIKYSLYGKTIHIKLSQDDWHVRCEIQDEGPGISKDDQKQLFTKFNTLSARPTGGELSVGLGLFIVNKLVKAMNSSILCESELGEGSIFIVEIPKNLS